jgi:DNA modification methylase
MTAVVSCPRCGKAARGVPQPRHKVVCGDSTDAEALALLLGGKQADLLLTDPPYGVSYSAKNEFLNNLDEGNRNETPIEADDRKPEEMRAFWTEVLANACAVVKPGGVYFSTGPQGGDLFLLLLLAFKDSGWLLKHMLIWVKNNHVLGRCDFHYKHEPILYGWKPGAGHYFSDEPGGNFSVWPVDKPHRSEEHPTMKPVALFAKAIMHGSRKGEIVLDPFLGSGTTLIACAETGRACVGVEISPRYCDVIRRRWTRWAKEHSVDPGPGQMEEAT